MKNLNLYLSDEAVSDRGVLIQEVCDFLNKGESSDFHPHTDNEIVEYEDAEDGQVEEIYWSVGQEEENHMGSYSISMEC